LLRNIIVYNILTHFEYILDSWENIFDLFVHFVIFELKVKIPYDYNLVSESETEKEMEADNLKKKLNDEVP
jgi:hypothetical protein